MISAVFHPLRLKQSSGCKFLRPEMYLSFVHVLAFAQLFGISLGKQYGVSAAGAVADLSKHLTEAAWSCLIFDFPIGQSTGITFGLWNRDAVGESTGISCIFFVHGHWSQIQGGSQGSCSMEVYWKHVELQLGGSLWDRILHEDIPQMHAARKRYLPTMWRFQFWSVPSSVQMLHGMSWHSSFWNCLQGSRGHHWIRLQQCLCENR